MQGKGPHKLVAPHELSSKLLFRVRRKDRAFAVACLDQPKVLRPVFQAFRKDALDARGDGNRDTGVGRTADRPRMRPQSAATCDSAYSSGDGGELNSESGCHDSRTTLHVWCANEERHALLETCSWSSALLATQGSEGHGSAGQACY